MVPTKINREALSVGFQVPQGEIEPSSFHDKDAEDVREQARAELREEAERAAMGEQDADHRKELPELEEDAPPGVSFGEAEMVETSEPLDVEVGDEIQGDINPGGAASSSRGTEVPQTPIFTDDGPETVAYVPQTPRGINNTCSCRR